MIPKAVFCEFLSRTIREDIVSGLNPPENARNLVQGSGCRF
jgi:hypothetical protein